jgi:hypothetical protein
MGITSEFIHNLIAKQLNDNSIVVWYNPEGAWSVPEAQMNSLERFHESMAFLSLNHSAGPKDNV